MEAFYHLKGGIYYLIRAIYCRHLLYYYTENLRRTPMYHEIVTRKFAIDNGLRYYYTGKPCKNGHSSKRNTITAICLKCISHYQKKNRIKINRANHLIALGCRKIEFDLKSEDVELVTTFINFINECRMNPVRKGDLELAKNYLDSLTMMWA